ncbi:unnamed protein product [Caenorhabditis angaria]|uniref:Uncharacterized protein n=1 Tax=Caenorhabditis angaria TaxID=860376 RepID=A0A9P1I6W4_9PELO|nr:unnamed protein product [Caenorhabditis angaria]
MYASKRRQRNFKRVRDPPKSLTTTNPSKRHRERLNGELETVAMLLPYDGSTISRLDKLSVLRLAVSFLQCKAHFQACMQNFHHPSPGFPLSTHFYTYTPQHPTPYSNKVPTIFDPRIGAPMLDHDESNFEDIALRALGGFILILNDNGEIYYASENVENFLGFHQSDVLHQPIYDLIHSEDRDDIRQQLDVNFQLTNAPIDPFQPQNAKYLERNVNARFRCLLDNTCGFLRIDMRGKLISLHGLPTSYILGRTNPGPVLGMICICTPFVPPSTSEMTSEDLILKTKHQLDGTIISMDHKVYEMLELTEHDMPMSMYQVIHAEDAICMAEAHKEVIKNGSSGLLVYRMVSKKSRKVYFVQSSCRLFYKNSKGETIGLTHRLLNEVEGTMLLEKRSSLKAKLLSFDDSFLQSPRNLQSTAALPLPPMMKDDEEPGVESQHPTTSALPATSQTVIHRPRRTSKEDHVVLHPPPPQVPPAPHFEIPIFDGSYGAPWVAPEMTGYYPHPSTTYMPIEEFPTHWMNQGAEIFTNQPPIQPPQVPIFNSSNQFDYSNNFHHHIHHQKPEGFNLISEVTNLLGQ